MWKVGAGLLLAVAGFVLWRGVPGLASGDLTPSRAAAANAPMTAQQLVDLSKSDPKAFDAYVMAHINDGQPATTESSDGAQAASPSEQKPMSLEEFVEAGRSDPQAIAELLASRAEPVESTEVDKLLNWLAHGKYE